MNGVRSGTWISGRPRAAAASTSATGTTSCTSPTPKPSPTTPARTRRSTYAAACDPPDRSRPSHIPTDSSSSPPSRYGVGSTSSLACTQVTSRCSRSDAASTVSPRACCRAMAESVMDMDLGGPLDTVYKSTPCTSRLRELSYNAITLGCRGLLSSLDGCVSPTSNARRPTVSPLTGGPGLPQTRRLVTAVPGPRSAELLARRTAAVARGVSTMLPVFVTRGGGGVLVDVDGNSLIDFGSGIAVVSVGNAAERVVEN